MQRTGRTLSIDLRIGCSCWSPCGPDDPCVIWRGLGLHHPVQRPCFDFLLQPDRRVLVTGCEPVPEPDTGEALMAEQGSHALPHAVAGDDYLGVVADPFDEGQALPGRFRRPIWPLKDPAVAEQDVDAGTLSLQLCTACGAWRHGKMIGTPASPGQDTVPLTLVPSGTLRSVAVIRQRSSEPLSQVDTTICKQVSAVDPAGVSGFGTEQVTG